MVNQLPKAPIVIGIAGGTGSGKTTFANNILHRVGVERVALLPHDAYYRNLTDLPKPQRDIRNFDHPDALETSLLIEHIQQLKAGQPVEMPIYDFTIHTRRPETQTVLPQPVILIDGILIFVDPDLRAQLDVKIYVEVAPDVRLIRRLQRDITERQRTVESVLQQYMQTVRPGHLAFVEPSKRFADVIIPQGGQNQVATDMLVARIAGLLHPKS